VPLLAADDLRSRAVKFLNLQFGQSADRSEQCEPEALLASSQSLRRSLVDGYGRRMPFLFAASSGTRAKEKFMGARRWF
jgi:hypothetical protein